MRSEGEAQGLSEGMKLEYSECEDWMGRVTLSLIKDNRSDDIE